MNQLKNINHKLDPVIKMKVRRFYKDIMKELPNILKYYNISLGIKEARSIIKSKFIEKSELTDIYIIQSQLKEGRKLLDETVGLWKTKKEVLEFFRKKSSNNLVKEEEVNLVKEFFKNSHPQIKDKF